MSISQLEVLLIEPSCTRQRIIREQLRELGTAPFLMFTSETGNQRLAGIAQDATPRCPHPRIAPQRCDFHFFLIF